MNTDRSQELFNAALKLMPGGVSSPVRAFRSVGGQPIVFDRVKGAYAWDVDGNRYIDYIGSWGPAICGHAHPEVIAALHQALDKGTSFGAPCALENRLAELVIEAVPSVEMVRFVNSGTEACMSVLRLMRAFTGREKLIKFEGCYHGHADMFLVKAGSGVATLGLPDSPGVPRSTTANTLTAPYNDLEAVKKLFAENPGEIAGVILEPVVGNAGFIVPEPGFLEGLRELTRDHGALLTFDEVMTGFRIAYGGAQAKFGVTPDLTTLGKVIGGGLPVGAYGGRADIMDLVAPAGPMYQAGTLSGNPLAMTAGIKTLELLKQPGTYERLDTITQRLCAGILAAGKEAGLPISGAHISAMFGFFLCDGPVRNFEEAKAADTAKFGQLHRAMLERGVYLAPSAFEAGFTSLAHSDSDIDATLTAFRACFAAIA
ncbi:glutamate-1-semialdehyde 2,1-aminomutase [Synechococcus sp. CS-602]|uniref:glutamate-1-semialdehyde 2,1-aminomutase n=1 Tax=Synechococcaceae TaxID=1890426 RepID=UPI0008FF3DA9|nr:MULTISPECIES: glutamate-1-semialdehyde 2,1-aminomutase [Synechococcaceae]MCT4365799.1 glutamate-1-semialdehyde 2,1-aminomutase [Candidatus Regnicoccus frigidus MAG-AL1]APD49624.1 glutamate-1-semialdehyde-2,1-aminomutase [Synechococcus sp. SynAce01]MCT0201014.1 glutamate-1-semialdehyde 2,1-aminomutase [Synechococcus sp. CS-603]MCT0205563.1 glutamate-1-semialdehyde 2,1-aminomutase [Synechococcus sp. CS-602]MCT0246900.1 glutamate-1-semialdehyde 2,1-aminomutase [Synechococcus sp. CS-601]